MKIRDKKSFWMRKVVPLTVASYFAGIGSAGDIPILRSGAYVDRKPKVVRIDIESMAEEIIEQEMIRDIEKRGEEEYSKLR
tara:strand:+ start:823 stop:1065 length:243 start_codon:yes stop_codon:yes gene_type:complete